MLAPDLKMGKKDTPFEKSNFRRSSIPRNIPINKNAKTGKSGNLPIAVSTKPVNKSDVFQIIESPKIKSAYFVSGFKITYSLKLRIPRCFVFHSFGF